MAKPKFELTADLVKVEPEPSEFNVEIKAKQIQQEQPRELEELKTDSFMKSTPPSFEMPPINKGQYFSQRPLLPQVPVIEQRVEQIEEEKERVGLMISKDLKRHFHLWCVQRGITMTDAIESAIKKYLQE